MNSVEADLALALPLVEKA